MEGFKESQLENDERHQDLGFQSDTPIENDKQLEFIKQEVEDLQVSCDYEVLDGDLPGHSVAMGEEDEVKQALDEELLQLVLKEAVNEAFQAECSSGSEDRKYWEIRRFMDEVIDRHGLKKVIEEDPKEFRVLEEREVGENGIGYEKEVKKVDDDEENVLEHKEDDLKEKLEINAEEEHDSSQVVGYEYNGEQRKNEDGNDREFENGKEVDNESEIACGEGGEGRSVTVPNDDRPKRHSYPLRPDAEDCSYYMRTGMCKFGSNCKFNHPLRRRNQLPKETMMKQNEEKSEKPGQTECKFYLSSGGCKYGKACKYNHSRGKTVVTPVVEYNFLGLPIRLGEKECPYYMRNGSCKYGPNCRYNHPDPTAVGGDVTTAYGNGGPVPLQSASQATMPSWPAPRTPDGTAAFVPVMYSPNQSMPTPNPDWNGYQAPAPVYPTSERSLPIPPAFFLNNPPSDTNLYTHHQQQMLVSDYPERLGQPECSYFMKTGDCKYKSACKFHHPKSRITKTTPSVLSDKGLPLRPDQNICTNYSRYGICKYGPACKYDHPVNYSSSMPAGGYQPEGSDGPPIQPPM